jgi:hypothetical protein
VPNASERTETIFSLALALSPIGLVDFDEMRRSHEGLEFPPWPVEDENISTPPALRAGPADPANTGFPSDRAT